MTEQITNTISQGILAKLLASENITVHVGNYTTAFFDVKNRILGLPSWNVENKAVSDLLIGHEVGHALWTPADGIENFKTELKHIPFSIVNILEDIRIERMIQDRYPGLISSFNQGYEHFLKKDFFKIMGRNVSEMGFADRLNLKAKLRTLIDVPFSAEEQEIFDRAYAAESFDDVVEIAKDVYELVKNEVKPEVGDGGDGHAEPDENAPINPCGDYIEPEDEDDAKEGDESDKDEDAPKEKKPTFKPAEEPETEADKSDDKDSDADKDEEDSTDDEDSDEDSDSDDDNDEADSDSEGEETDLTVDSDAEADDEEDDSEESGLGSTDESEESDESTEEETGEENDSTSSRRGSRTAKELKPRKKQPYKSVEDELNSSTLDSLNDELSNLHTDFGHRRPIMMPSAEQLRNCVTGWKKVIAGRMSRPSYQEEFINDSRVSEDWAIYKRNVRKHIQNLITDFERKKAAFQYSRAHVSDAGDIDVNRLHVYKFDDQIFRTITKLADCKNHGMMFFIDYSGSMANDIFNVLDHTLNLVAFCNAVKIPFQVFGFTNSCYRDEDLQINRREIPSTQFSLDNVNIFEMLSSEMKPKEMELGMRQMRAQVLIGRRYGYYSIPFSSPWESMSGTPLNETIIVAHDLVAKFRKKYRVQKMNVLILSDGEGQGFRVGSDTTIVEENVKETTYRETRYITQLAGRTIELAPNDNNRNYAVLIHNLKVSLGCTMIGFFISRRKKDLRVSSINSIRYSYKHGLNETTQGDWATASAMTERESSSFRKNRCSFIPGGFNFDCYFLIDARDARIHGEDSFDSKINDDEFEGQISTQVQNKLAREFTKFTSDKKSSRIILNRFAEIIA
jgi:hypothetical protein